jgi:hypothetical protein
MATPNVRLNRLMIKMRIRAMRMTPMRIVMEKKMKNRMVAMISLEKSGRQTKRKKRQRRSPIKSRWFLPLIKETIVESPNMSHKECAHLLRLYVRTDFLTAMIVQNAKMQCRFELFGNPTMNAQCTTAMLRETSFWGHKVKSIYKTAADVMTMMEKIVVQEESDQRQASEGISMTRAMKKEYLSEWMSVKNDMLQSSGLDIQMIGKLTPQFCRGVFFSMSYSNEVVPYLQNVFQADAAHMNLASTPYSHAMVPLLMQTHLLLLLPFYLATF